MADDFKPVAAADVADPALVATELRMLRAEMKHWFEILAARLTRFDQRIAALELDRSDANKRLDDHETRLAAIEACLAQKAS